MSFDFSDLHPSLRRAIDDLGFDSPTPIQRDSIPPALDGRNLLACAMTGSGKTAAFLIPIIERLRTSTPGTTRALVLTPTRELAAQIVESFQGLARHTRLKAMAVYGGVGMRPQEQALRRGVDLIVACPGRLLDHFQHDYARVNGLEVLVLDEADRMLDMGFLPDIRRILMHLPQVDQTHLFSATMPQQIVELSRQQLDRPVRINVERRSAPAKGITQAVFPVRQELKSELLFAMLEQTEVRNMLVFTRTKHRADRLTKFLVKRGIEADRIHGNRSQGQRTRALAGFKNHEIQVLVATDIAARGIDVELLSHVVNFDVPHMPEDYIHRVGLTARAEATGEAFTFVSPQEEQDLRGIERAVGKKLPRRTLEGFDASAKVGEPLEIPIKDRIAAIRARRSEERARARAKGGDGRSGSRSGGRGQQGKKAGASKRRGAGAQSEGQSNNRRRRSHGHGGPAGESTGTSRPRQEQGAKPQGTRSGRSTQSASHDGRRSQGQSQGQAQSQGQGRDQSRPSAPRGGGRPADGRPAEGRARRRRRRGAAPR